VLAFQASCGARVAFDGLVDEPQLVRGSSSYVRGTVASGWSRLAERVRVEFDPDGVLV
jgi:hypothetical protein